MDQINQNRAYLWAMEAFGEEHVHDPKVRALRVVEEAVELAQALDVPVDQVRRCADVVYSRPPGDPDQEMGGVLLSLSILCSARSASLYMVFRRELRRVLAKPVAHFTARNQAKIDAGLTGS